MKNCYIIQRVENKTINIKDMFMQLVIYKKQLYIKNRYNYTKVYLNWYGSTIIDTVAQKWLI